MSASADKFGHLAALRPVRRYESEAVTPARHDSEDQFAQLIGGTVAKNRFGEHLVVRNWYSTPEYAELSSMSLTLLTRTRDESISWRTRAALEDPARWLFLDTETTGLAGGTGTYPFLVGIAWWDAGGLQVEQFFMRDFGEEHSLLHALAERLAERSVLFTFNGKAFDWPLLENRFTMTRAIRVPKLAAHLDLLHPARALWKLRLGSVRLTELERCVLDPARLGWHREDDVSAALIPQYYFDYLRGGSGHPLAGVLRHNQMDLRGLAALYGKINSVLASQAAERDEIPSLDLFGLARFLDRRGESDAARVACAQALDLGLPAEYRPRACHDLALLAKRRGDHAAAAELWHELAADPQDGVLACEQLAIHYERRAKDCARAAEFARLGLAKLKHAQTNSRDPYAANRALQRIAKFQNRINRLERKNGPRQRNLGDSGLLRLAGG